jgi:hypothetical protein
MPQFRKIFYEPFAQEHEIINLSSLPIRTTFWHLSLQLQLPLPQLAYTRLLFGLRSKLISMIV